MAKPSKTSSTTSAAPVVPSLNVINLPIESLRPNDWNVNRMDAEMMHKLTEYVRKEGLVEPIIVRKKLDYHEIIGGFHRWSICKDRLGYTEIPCVVLDLDDHRAKVLSINLNQMSGQPVPMLLANLLHDLNKSTALTDLETQLPFSQAQMEDSLELLKLPDGLDAYLEEQAAKEAAAAPVIVTVVLDQKQNQIFEAAMEHAQAVAGASKNQKGRSLEVICQGYLDTQRTSSDVPTDGAALTAAASREQ